MIANQNYSSRCLLALLLVLCPMIIFSQGSLRAGFTASVRNELPAFPRTGCAPLFVSFTDQSTGNPTQWHWDFGNGIVSTQANPSTTYFTPGNYTIRLIVRNAQGADSLVRVDHIRVSPTPEPGFSSDLREGCAPFRVSFTDTSRFAGANATYQWDFGDGILSNDRSPVHVYQVAGTYTVSLKLTSELGCTKTISRTAYVQVKAPPRAQFTNSNPVACRLPFSVQFTNTSTGSGNTYQWSFGNGAVSAAVSPQQVFTTAGNFTVSLIATGYNGCRDTLVRPNLVQTGAQTLFTVPATICAGADLSLQNQTLPAPVSQVWYFGDGTTATAFNPAKTYAAPGTFTIKLVSRFAACSDSFSRTVTVNPAPEVDFQANRLSACLTPAPFAFTPVATGASAYSWDFGDGSRATTMQASHSYTSFGTYTVTLAAVNAFGCTDTMRKTAYIRVERPQITLDGVPASGCLPLRVRPVATVQGTDPVTTYSWNIGGVSYSQENPEAIFTQAGSYGVSLTVTTAGGCSNTVSLPDGARALTRPVASFTWTPSDVCLSDAVQFTNTSTGTQTGQQWLFGDGGTSFVQHPTYRYTDTGRFSVTLIAANETCRDTIRQERIIRVRPPVARFSEVINCTDKFRKTFTDSSIGASTWAWEFGDGSTSAAQHPTHLYRDTGTYTVRLLVSDGSCQHRMEKRIRVINTEANFQLNANPVCAGTPVRLSTPTIRASQIARWAWDFGNGTADSTASVVLVTYPDAGARTLSLTITDRNGCTDTKTRNLQVNGPKARFTVAQSPVCFIRNVGARVSFDDQSTSDGSNSIVRRIWTLGDGRIDSSGMMPMVHHYQAGGTFTVRLTVRDAAGCVSTLTRTGAVNVIRATASFTTADTTTCAGRNVTFRNSSGGVAPLQFSWNFGDGNASSLRDPVNRYSADGSYTVTLAVSDNNGCRDTLVRNQYIRVIKPVARFELSDTLASCPPLLVRFTNHSQNQVGVSWSFGNGNSSAASSPAHMYNTPGIFYPRLIVQGAGGCADTLVRRVEVRGPSGSLSYTPVGICAPVTVNLTAHTRNRDSIIWDFGNGYTHLGVDSVIRHIYNDTGAFVPRMILTDRNGCSVSYIGRDTIRSYGISVQAAGPQRAFCDSATVSFTASATGNDAVAGWLWNFGNGQTSTQPHPVRFFGQPGTYPVSVRVRSVRGCSQEMMLPAVLVHAAPKATVSLPEFACAPANLQIQGALQRPAAGNLQWSWDFGNGQTASGQSVPQQYYATPGTYYVTLVVRDETGCSDSVRKVFYVYGRPQVTAGADLEICQGASANLQAQGAATYSWSGPALSCTSCPTPQAQPAQTAVYFVTGTSAQGCQGTDTVRIRVRQPFALGSLRDTAFCAGGSTLLRANGGDIFSWSPSAGLEHPDRAITRARPETTTTYTLTARDSAGCFTRTARVTVSVFQQPRAEVGPDLTLRAGDTASLRGSYSSDVNNWRWTPSAGLSCSNCPAPVVTARQSTRYQVRASNPGGCSTTDEVTVTVLCNGGNLFLPNTFSPNGDGMNDVFFARGTGIAHIRALRIYNRWGELVYERLNFKANDPQSGWDGQLRGRPASSDVYIYAAEVVCSNNQILPVKGDITLLR